MKTLIDSVKEPLKARAFFTVSVIFVLATTALAQPQGAGPGQTLNQEQAQNIGKSRPGEIIITVPALSFEVRAGDTPRLVPSLAFAAVSGCGPTAGQGRSLKIPLEFDSTAMRIRTKPFSFALQSYMVDQQHGGWVPYDPSGLPSHLGPNGESVPTAQPNQECSETSALYFYFNLELPGTAIVHFNDKDTLLSEIADGKNFEVGDYGPQGPLSFQQREFSDLSSKPERIISLTPLHKFSGTVVLEGPLLGVAEAATMPVWIDQNLSYAEALCLHRLALGARSITFFGSEPTKAADNTWHVQYIRNSEKIFDECKKDDSLIDIQSQKEFTPKAPRTKGLKRVLPSKKSKELEDKAAITANQLLGNGN